MSSGLQIKMDFPPQSVRLFSDDLTKDYFSPMSKARGTYWYGIFQGTQQSSLFCPEFYLGEREKENYGDMAYIIKLGALLVLLAVVALFFGAKAGQLAAVASSGYAKNLRHDIFYKIQDFSFGNIDHFSTPGLVTRLTTDITNVQMAYMFTIRLLARAPIMIVMSLIMTVTISPAIASIFTFAT